MRTLFGGIIAIVLLGLYAWLIVVAAGVAVCAAPAACGGFNSGMAQALSVTTGLVSALVIAELAVTPAGGVPAAHLLTVSAAPQARTWLRWISSVYIAVWLLAGLVAFVIGLTHPDALPALTSAGQAWFGVAVAAAYAYLGIKPAA